MAEFRGFKCDDCGNLIEDNEQRTKVSTQFEGPVLNGSFRQDLCPDCVPNPEESKLTPVKRRGSKEGSGTVTEAVQDTASEPSEEMETKFLGAIASV